MEIRARTRLKNFQRVSEWMMASSKEITYFNDGRYIYIEKSGSPLFSWTTPSRVTSESLSTDSLFYEVAELISQQSVSRTFKDFADLLSISRPLLISDVPGLIVLIFQMAFEGNQQAFIDFIFNYLDTKKAVNLCDKKTILFCLYQLTESSINCFVRYNSADYFFLERRFVSILKFFNRNYGL